MKRQSGWPDICSINPMQAVGCHLQTRAGIRARGRSCCRSGCTGQGPRAKPLQRLKRPLARPATPSRAWAITVSGKLVVIFADGATRLDPSRRAWAAACTDQTAGMQRRLHRPRRTARQQAAATLRPTSTRTRLTIQAAALVLIRRRGMRRQQHKPKSRRARGQPRTTPTPRRALQRNKRRPD